MNNKYVKFDSNIYFSIKDCPEYINLGKGVDYFLKNVCGIAFSSSNIFQIIDHDKFLIFQLKYNIPTYTIFDAIIKL